MSFSLIAAVVSIFYFVIWFFDSFFKSCMHYPYYAFLEGTGLKVGILNFSWKTAAFNRILFRWGKHYTNFLKAWFTYGCIFSVLIFLPFAIWTLSSTVINNLWREDKESTTLEIETVVPGVNLPLEDVWFYFIAIAVSSVIHELGHALAAVQEDVQLLTIGFYMFLIIPIAFVELSTEQLSSLSAKKRLNILCAGVWHNITLGFFSFVVLLSVSSIFKFGYEIGNGVRVIEFKSYSPLYGERGLVVADRVTMINNCKIEDSRDWYSCIFSTTTENFGLCVTSDFLSINDEIVDVIHKGDLVECCGNENKQSLCFEYVEGKSKESNVANQYSCLSPREIVREKFITCTEKAPCPHNNHCLKPLLGNGTHLFVVEVFKKEPVLYIGSPFDFYSVRIDHYIPKFSYLGAFSPLLVEKLFEYILVLSVGLGIVNILPCVATDGHRIAGSLIQLAAKRFNKDNEFVNATTICVTSVGTLVTLPSLIYLFAKTLMSAY